MAGGTTFALEGAGQGGGDGRRREGTLQGPAGLAGRALEPESQLLFCPGRHPRKALLTEP